MTVSCRRCRWGQDDFWDECYNPVACLLADREMLAAALPKARADRVMVYDIGLVRDRQIPAEPTPHGAYRVPLGEILARRFEQLAGRIRQMRWWTFADWKADPDTAVSGVPIARLEHGLSGSPLQQRRDTMRSIRVFGLPALGLLIVAGVGWMLADGMWRVQEDAARATDLPEFIAPVLGDRQILRPFSSDSTAWSTADYYPNPQSKFWFVP